MGCGDTLFLGKEGYVTCSYLRCPNPSRVNQLLTQFEGRESYMIFVTKESEVHWVPNGGVVAGTGFVVYQGTAPDRVAIGRDKGGS